MVESSNRRIAKNTVYMYARLFVTLIIGLYTSRVVLYVLGVSDYGLFNIVGGVLTLFTFITGSLGAATSRFLNAEMGKKDGDVNRIYNINIVLHICFAAIVLIIAETAGLWYIYNKLVIAQGKLDDAIFVYQISIITSCVGIINTPCTSIFSAKEKFAFQVVLDITNNVVRLLCVIALQYYNGNSLRAYTLIMCLTTANSFVIYHIVANRRWPEITKFRFIKGLSNYKPVLSFGSWNLLTTSSIMMRNTGSDLIVNTFFGTAVNGIFAISKTISIQVLSFSANFSGASSPQIIQTYNSGDFNRCYYLVNKMGRFNLLLFELALFPIWIELDLILHLWLKEVPDGVLLLCKLNLILAGVSLTCGGIVSLITGSGKVKWFDCGTSLFYIGCLPLAYVLYSFGFPLYTILLIYIITDIGVRITHLVLLKKILNFNSLKYIKEAYLRPLLIMVIMSGLIYGYSFLGIESTVLRLAAIICCVAVTSMVVFYIGLTRGEREKIISKIINLANKDDCSRYDTKNLGAD